MRSCIATVPYHINSFRPPPPISYLPPVVQKKVDEGDRSQHYITKMSLDDLLELESAPNDDDIAVTKLENSYYKAQGQKFWDSLWR